MSLALLGLNCLCLGQQADKADYYWMHGIIGPPQDPKIYAFNIRFEKEEISLKKINGQLAMGGCNASYSDESGNLLMYTNGIHIADSSLQIMENGDSISEMSINTIFKYYKHGYPFTRSSMFLPVSKNKYQLVMILMDTIKLNPQLTILKTKYLTSSEIDFNSTHPQGVVVKKRETIFKNKMAGGNLTACRHANGKDWWILLKQDSTEVYFRFLVNDTGFTQSKNQTFPIPLQASYSGGSAFTPDGTKYCHIDAQFGIQLFDFDRCTGELSNFRYLSMPYEAPIGDIVISPNSRFLYALTGSNIIQFDLNTIDLASFKASADTVGYTDPKYKYTNFAVGALAPDGKIYITSSGSVENQNYFSIIHFPDRKGKDCNLELIGIKPPFQNSSGSMPNFPNYRLGPVDGSVCDSLGIDNVPKSRFRINHDTMDVFTKEFTDLSFREPTDWFWTFGDGATSNKINPIHNYLSTGVYEVCLTVSNVNGSDTSCKELGIWTVSTKEQKEAELFVYPNPTIDKLTIRLNQGVSTEEEWQIKIFDLQGSTRYKGVMPAYSYVHTIDVQGLATGMYILELSDREGKVLRRKFVKE